MTTQPPKHLRPPTPPPSTTTLPPNNTYNRSYTAAIPSSPSLPALQLQNDIANLPTRQAHFQHLTTVNGRWGPTRRGPPYNEYRCHNCGRLLDVVLGLGLVHADDGTPYHQDPKQLPLPLKGALP